MRGISRVSSVSRMPTTLARENTSFSFLWTRKEKERRYSLMEEQQIQDFVHRVSNDEALRTELTTDPEGVLVRESFSPRVAAIVRRLVPHLTFASAFESESEGGPWWG